MTLLKNTLPGILDLAPVKDEHGHVLVFRGNETKRVTDESLGHPITQRVMSIGWLMVVQEAPPETPKPSVAMSAASSAVIKTSAPPEELKLPAELEQAETAALEPASSTSTTQPLPIVADVPPTGDAPLTSDAPTKPGKPSRK